MNKKNYILLVIIFCCTAFNDRESSFFSFPEHFPSVVYDLEKNQLTQEKINLGRALFYDPILSKDGTISCASCHSPYNGFAHTDHNLSHGINDQIGTRNAPPLFNLAWQTSFNWDGAINHLDMQALAPLNDVREMGETTDSVIVKLQNSKLYPQLFAAAFQDSVITGQHFLQAIAAFELTLISANAKYDKVKNGEEEFTKQEANGYKLFQKNCNSCHSEPLFSNYGFAHNGLAIDTTLNDYGRGQITEEKSDSLAFKIPSLRNLKFTHPYMHDGRFKRLNEVLQHYTTSTELKNPIILSSNEKTDLIAFLLTLNDTEFIFNPDNKYPRDILLRK
jgi:cytochrome c peroxidase